MAALSQLDRAGAGEQERESVKNSSLRGQSRQELGVFRISGAQSKKKKDSLELHRQAWVRLCQSNCHLRSFCS